MRRASWVPLAATAAALLTADVRASGATAEAERAVNGDWVAYATAPATDLRHRDGYQGGSDVFIVQPGGTPKLVAGRGNGTIWSACPAFSPNGRLLAFGEKSPYGRSIRIVGLSRDGTIGEGRTVSKVRGATVPCPKWSADGKRIAYLDAKRTPVVMTIGGAKRAPRAGDPAIEDFSRNDTAVVSPDGALVARRAKGNCEVVVSRRDGANSRVVDDFPCSYAIAGWSPDSRKLLVMKDMDGHRFAMVAVPVSTSADAAGVVVGVRVNHARSWPGYGDVSWQPKP